MTAFPQELRDLAVLAERAQEQHENAINILRVAYPSDPAYPDLLIARAMNAHAAHKADTAFKDALEVYMVGGRK